MPATVVSTILSERICCRISLGRAPIARRMPISVVRSLTVTIIMLDTPIAPANKVPRPTIQIRMRVPVIRVSIMENIASALRNMIACLSSGEM